MKFFLQLLIFIVFINAAPISDFSFEGNRRTKESTILRIARINENEPITDSILTLASERLMKSDLFVSASVTQNDQGVIDIQVDERWTIVPYFNMTLGKKVVSARTGLYDINLLGRNFVLGGEYHYFNRTHNGQIFSSKKDIGRYRLKLHGNLSMVKSINVWYTPTGSSEAAFLIDRRSITLKSEIPLHNENLFAGISLGISHDTLLEEMNDIDFRETNKKNGYSFDGENSTFSPAMTLRYSGIRHHAFTYDGWGVKGSFSHGFQSNFDGYNVFSLKAQWYKKLPLESNLCMNFGTAVSDGTDITSYLYLGGLNAVRGFNNGEFRGRAYVKGNIEYRLPSLNTRLLVFQHIFFMDYATITERVSSPEKSTSIFGSGIGIRILSPKVYSFMIRADYGFGWGPYRRHQFYFGTSHYFLPF